MGEFELIYWLKLCNVRGLGPKKIMKLFALFHDIDSIINAEKEELLRSKIFNEQMVDDWIKLKSASSETFEKVLSDCKENNIRMIPLYSKEYPIELKIISSPPLNLFLQGNISLLKTKKVAVVGSRESNSNAKEWTFNISKDLTKKEITIVSGGAKGIDIEAHKGSLSVNGETICVIASGLLNLYPEENKKYFAKIRETGLLISENLPNFLGSNIALLRRNRIISAISDAMIVVTSSGGGGTMTQLDHAFEQRIPIFCPKENLNLLPREGIIMRKNQYNITEIESIEQIIETTNKKKPTFITKQVTLM